MNKGKQFIYKVFKDSRKVLCFVAVLFLAIVLNFSFAPAYNDGVAHAATDNVIIVFNDTEASRSDVFTLTASLSKNPGIAALQLQVVYDTTAMTLTDVQNGSALDGFQPTGKTGDDYAGQTVNLQWICSADSDTSTGVLVKLTFKVKADAVNGSYNVGFKFNKNDCYSQESGTSELTYRDLVIGEAKVTIGNGAVTDIQPVDDGDSTTGGLTPGGIAGVVIAAVAALAIGVAFIVVKSKKNSKTAKKAK